MGVEQIMKDIGAEVNVKKMRIKTDREEWGELDWAVRGKREM